MKYLLSLSLCLCLAMGAFAQTPATPAATTTTTPNAAPDWWLVKRTVQPLVEMDTRSGRKLVGALLTTTDIAGSLPAGKFGVLRMQPISTDDTAGVAYLSQEEMKGLVRCFDAINNMLATQPTGNETILFHANDANLEAGLSVVNGDWRGYIRYLNGGPTVQLRPKELQGMQTLLAKVQEAMR